MFGFGKKNKTALEYQKDRQDNKYLQELQAQQERDLRDDASRKQDLQHACPKCRMIRSAYEIKKGTCNNCD